MLSSPVVGFLGNREGSVAPHLEFNQFMEAIGENTGNLMFQHAAWGLIDNEKVQFRFGIDQDVELFRKSIDVLYIPAANQLNPDWDLAQWGEFIEYLDKPVVIAGLGAQAKIGEVRDIKLQPGTLTLIKILSKRAAWIGVRGEATAMLLASHGITNTLVTGCPSNFISTSLNGITISKQLADNLQQGPKSVNYVFGTMEDYARQCEATLFRLCRDLPGNIIFQTNPEVFLYLNTGLLNDLARENFSWQTRALRTGLSDQEYLDVILNRGRFFSEASSWLAFSRNVDLTIGMRIHGAIAAIQGGSLGICVAFDSRTLELAETMGYPHLKAEDVEKAGTLKDVIEMVNFSSFRFDEKRRLLARNLKKVMQQHGITTERLNYIL